jgi:hypothetical protein
MRVSERLEVIVCVGDRSTRWCHQLGSRAPSAIASRSIELRRVRWGDGWFRFQLCAGLIDRLGGC